MNDDRRQTTDDGGTTPIRVMLVDDHTMVRRGLATFLKVFDDLELVGEAGDGETAVSLCGQILPDVVLMDMLMPDVDGVTATRLIRQQFPSVQVLALTSFKEEGLVQSALQAGAIGYLLKDVSAARIGPGHSCRPRRPGHALAGGCAVHDPRRRPAVVARLQSDRA
jgi:CheY-like chemotaxis protein